MRLLTDQGGESTQPHKPEQRKRYFPPPNVGCAVSLYHAGPDNQIGSHLGSGSVKENSAISLTSVKAMYRAEPDKPNHFGSVSGLANRNFPVDDKPCLQRPCKQRRQRPCLSPPSPSLSPPVCCEPTPLFFPVTSLLPKPLSTRAGIVRTRTPFQCGRAKKKTQICRQKPWKKYRNVL